jgi:hypothetical protein
LTCRKLVGASGIISSTSCVRILRLRVKIALRTRTTVDALSTACRSGLARVLIFASLLISRLAMRVNHGLANLHKRCVGYVKFLSKGETEVMNFNHRQFF